MYKSILTKMWEKVRTRNYILTLHAEEDMENDKLTIFDVENCILTGEIIERQKDKNTGEWKYVVRGKCYGFNRNLMIVVSKISISDKLVVLTVFLD